MAKGFKLSCMLCITYKPGTSVDYQYNKHVMPAPVQVFISNILKTCLPFFLKKSCFVV